MGFYCHVSYTFFQGTFANPDLFSSFLDSDGNGSLFGTLSGNTREVIHKFTVDLPKKHGRGGQSALRFSRLREEARRNYVRKVAELAVQHFITADKVNVAGLVLAGSAELKTDLSGSDLFDPRLLAKVVKVVDVSYGGLAYFDSLIRLMGWSAIVWYAVRMYSTYLFCAGHNSFFLWRCLYNMGVCVR